MKAIVCVDKNWGIGKDGDLLISLRKDMQFFREVTMNKTIVMGRKTLESFKDAKPLKNTNFNGYEIRLSEVDKGSLQVASGDEAFYFLLNDKTTQNFLPQHQDEILKSNEAYSCIYK